MDKNYALLQWIFYSELLGIITSLSQISIKEASPKLLITKSMRPMPRHYLLRLISRKCVSRPALSVDSLGLKTSNTGFHLI